LKQQPLKTPFRERPFQNQAIPLQTPAFFLKDPIISPRAGCPSEPNESRSEQDLSCFERDKTHSERDLSRFERDKTHSEQDLSRFELKIFRSEQDLSRFERDKTHSERDLSRFELKVSHSERDLFHLNPYK
jgi:septal ring factor EnvC (AmiA/AmiB activator)